MTFARDSGRSPVPVHWKGTMAIGRALSTPPVMTISNAAIARGEANAIMALIKILGNNLIFSTISPLIWCTFRRNT